MNNEQNKICPSCGSEYYPHIQKCADCGAVLLSADEHKKAGEERQRAEQKAIENSAMVLEGDRNWLSELRTVLLDSGIPCMLHSDISCRKGCCGDTWQLKVSSEDLEKAQETIEEYLMELEPDLRIAREMMGQGKCPACGSSTGHDARECPDCGLPLIIVED